MCSIQKSVPVLHSNGYFPIFPVFNCRDASNRSQPTDYSSSSDRSEELRTPDSIDEPWEVSDGRGSPQGGRRYPGLQMMGSGLLAEMKAKQERRAYKVRWFKKVITEVTRTDSNMCQMSCACLSLKRRDDADFLHWIDNPLIHRVGFEKYREEWEGGRTSEKPWGNIFTRNVKIRWQLKINYQNKVRGFMTVLWQSDIEGLKKQTRVF